MWTRPSLPGRHSTKAPNSWWRSRGRCSLAHLDLGAAAAEGVDLLHGAIHGVGVVGIDVDLAGIVLGDVDLRAGDFGDAADGLAAGPDEQADLSGLI